MLVIPICPKNLLDTSELCENNRQKRKMFEEGGFPSNLSAIPALRGQSYRSRKAACFLKMTENNSFTRHIFFLVVAALMLSKTDPN